MAIPKAFKLYLKEIKDNAQIESTRTNYYTGIQESYKKDSNYTIKLYKAINNYSGHSTEYIK